MRKPEENNKFRKKDFTPKERSNKTTSGKEPFKKQHGSKSEHQEKHICPPGECDLAKKCGGCEIGTSRIS